MLYLPYNVKRTDHIILFLFLQSAIQQRRALMDKTVYWDSWTKLNIPLLSGIDPLRICLCALHVKDPFKCENVNLAIRDVRAAVPWGMGILCTNDGLLG